MNTVTYQVHHWTDEDTGAGDCFEVIECTTLHVVTGDEYSEFGIAAFDTQNEATGFISTLYALNS